MNEVITITAGIKDDTAAQLWPSNITVNKELAHKDPEEALRQAISTEAEKYTSIVISDKKSYGTIMTGQSIFRTARTSIEKRRLELGDDHKKYINLLNLTAKKLTSMITPVEDQLKAKRKAWDDAQEAIQQEAERKEMARVKAINDRIEAIKSLIPTVPTGSDKLCGLTFDLDIMVIGPDFQEFQGQAEAVRVEALDKINKLISDRIQWEEEEKKRKEEFARLEAIKAENDRLEAERKEKADAEEKTRRAEREAFEAEKRALAEEREKIEAVKREEQSRKDREVKEKRDAIDRTAKQRNAMLALAGCECPPSDIGIISEDEFMSVYKGHKTAWDIMQEEARVVAEEKAAHERAEFERIAKENAEQEAKERQDREEEERKLKAEEEAAEAARQEALKPDKEKLLDFADRLDNLNISETVSQRAKTLVFEIVSKVDDLVNFVRTEVERL